MFYVCRYLQNSREETFLRFVIGPFSNMDEVNTFCDKNVSMDKGFHHFNGFIKYTYTDELPSGILVDPEQWMKDRKVDYCRMLEMAMLILNNG